MWLAQEETADGIVIAVEHDEPWEAIAAAAWYAAWFSTAPNGVMIYDSAGRYVGQAYRSAVDGVTRLMFNCFSFEVPHE